MFGSTAILPPRTKRWAEAKVLADCINLKAWRFALSSVIPSLISKSADLQALSVQQRARTCSLPTYHPHKEIQRLLAWLGNR